MIRVEIKSFDLSRGSVRARVEFRGEVVFSDVELIQEGPDQFDVFALNDSNIRGRVVDMVRGSDLWRTRERERLEALP